jgi:hypothetical protein
MGGGFLCSSSVRRNTKLATMLLDHSPLEPFEPTIRDLMACAYGQALRGLARAGLKPGDEWHTEAARMFKATCLPGFRESQDAVATMVLDLEGRIDVLKRREATERAHHNASAASSHRRMRTVLQNRQLVLRSLNATRGSWIGSRV